MKRITAGIEGAAAMKLTHAPLSHLGPSEPRSARGPYGRQRASGLHSIRRRYFAVLLTLGVGAVGSIGAFSAARSWELHVAKFNFESIAQDRQRVIADDFENSMIVLQTLRALLESADYPVSRGEFDRFSRSLHRFAAGLRDTGWAPRVVHAERAAFEQSVRDTGVPGFEIREPGPGGKIVRAGDRDEYYPILYSEGDPRTSRVLGIDVAFEGERRAALHRTLATGSPSATPPVRLLTLAADKSGLMSLQVVGDRAAPHGIVFGVFDAAEMIDSIMSTKIRLPGLDVYMFAPQAQPDAAPIYAMRSEGGNTPVPGMAALVRGPHWSATVPIADQPWNVVFKPAAHFMANERSWTPLMWLGAGLTLTSMAALYLLLSIRRTGQLEALTMTLRRTTSELSCNMARVTYLARHDQLTTLPNRVVFHERLQAAISRMSKQRPVFLLYLDLDRFKPINDTLGHAAGDQILCEAAVRMRTCLREDDVLARLGGDEFAVISLTARTKSGALTLANRLVELVSGPYTIDDNVVAIGVSIGIAAAPQDGDTDVLLQMRADQALYAAKNAGRGVVRFFTDAAASSLPLEDQTEGNIACPVGIA